jgi:nucleoside-diphosphate-sugar epimerase
MQTILGAGGVIGRELAKALPQYTDHIRLVNRHPERVNPTDDLVAASLLDAAAVSRAVAGSDIVYLTAGLPYQASVWEAQWPPLVEHVLAACAEHGARLVFFDNIYMYDPQSIGNLTETAPIAPKSRKGKVRAQIARRILAAHASGEVTALIARSADFYGPGATNSVLTETVIEPLAAGGKANYLGSVGYRHSFTYTPDAGRATALLGNTPDAYGEVWHLPTAQPAWTGRQWIEAFARAFGTAPRYREIGPVLLWFLGWFVPIMREIREMYYQNAGDYIFDSSKFTERFDFTPTPYDKGVQAVAAAHSA